MSLDVYLPEFTDTVESLEQDVARTFSQIHDIDAFAATDTAGTGIISSNNEDEVSASSSDPRELIIAEMDSILDSMLNVPGESLTTQLSRFDRLLRQYKGTTHTRVQKIIHLADLVQNDVEYLDTVYDDIMPAAPMPVQKPADALLPQRLFEPRSAARPLMPSSERPLTPPVACSHQKATRKEKQVRPKKSLTPMARPHTVKDLTPVSSVSPPPRATSPYSEHKNDIKEETATSSASERLMSSPIAPSTASSPPAPSAPLADPPSQNRHTPKRIAPIKKMKRSGPTVQQRTSSVDINGSLKRQLDSDEPCTPERTRNGTGKKQQVPPVESPASPESTNGPVSSIYCFCKEDIGPHAPMIEDNGSIFSALQLRKHLEANGGVQDAGIDEQAWRPIFIDFALHYTVPRKEASTIPPLCFVT
ncbi:hypothetical protein HDU85_007792 [Gaertneriomyces sp. JEL0708]|nr:hypothetical protein HDU85_007792 [Gaertneriomyces sp. JEL0708]